MAKYKTARSGEYIITQDVSGSISVAKFYDNVKGALREIAGKIGFSYSTDWTTRQFGKNLIEHINGEHVKTSESAIAKYGEYVIYKETSGSIQAYKDYDNVKGALREISAEIGFKYDTEWTTRQFGSKLIDHIKG